MPGRRGVDETFERLDGALETSLGDRPAADDPPTVLFSGGVDSSILALALARSGPLRLFSIGMEGSDDIVAARRAADLLRLNLTERRVTPEEVANSVKSHGLAARPEPARSVLASLGVALATSPRGGPLVLGQGADELFGGYAHFRSLTPAAAERRRRDDWDRLLRVDWPATQAIAGTLGRTLFAPFVDARFATAAFAIPLPSVGPGDLTKPVLRAWARHRGVPAEVANRPKRAIQYGTGIASVVRRSLRA
ncbi:MAG: asparagine synthase C-terminal domain-containing protein [Thermoplasmata archaeon]|nr:asparagine synthase C-terminal domain-containing protein [Thermoplasmata archaeon]